MYRRKGRALRRRYGRSHTAARHLAEQALRVAHDNPTIKSLDLATRLYEQASQRAAAEGHNEDASRLWSIYNDLAPVRAFPIGNESQDEARERARTQLWTIIENEPRYGRSP